MTADPLELRRALEGSDRFRRDTPLGGIFHPGRFSFREISPTDSLHITIDGKRVSAHVDRVSPLSRRSGGRSQYALGRILAHNLSGMAAQAVRWLRGRPTDHRCQLDCEVVWLDGDSVDGAVVAEAESRPDVGTG